jgi:iron complex outermembrane receptor protein
VYATFTEGFKSGGFNVGIPQAPYQPEKIKEYELGLKSTELQGRMQLNTDFFYYDYNNLQVTVIRLTNAVIENAATAALYGADIDLVALPVSNLRLDASLSLLHSEYISYSSAKPAFPTQPAQNLSGNQLTQAPRYEGRLGSEYSWNVPGGALKLRGDFSYTSRTYFTPFDERSLSQGGHSLTNGSLDYTASSRSWHAGLFVNNLTNNKVIAQDYVASLLFGGPIVGVLTPPRTYGVRGGVSF